MLGQKIFLVDSIKIEITGSKLPFKKYCLAVVL